MGGTPSVLDPQGAARYIADLWWLLAGLGSVIFVLVMLYLAVALWRKRSNGAEPLSALPPAAPPVTRAPGLRPVILGGIVLPLAVLSVVTFATVQTLRALSAMVTPELLTIEVIGQQWWWEVRYPAEGFETANEIHIPVGQPVALELRSDNVIHSFWVPELHGKLDLIPGRTNRFVIQADEAGVYRGLCAEFCGVQHANMMFLVIAQPPAEFAQWLAAQQQPAQPPTAPVAQAGAAIFMESTCMNCHAINGTDATGDLGPDLTHFAARRTLGAAILPNNVGNLGGWIANPQHLKPGNLMPPTTDLTGAELQALLAYLQTLE